MKRTTLILSLLLLPAILVADEVAVTVYNSNLGVVSETRTLDFNKGIGQLDFTDVPSAIDASSVIFNVIDKSGRVAILEQNYAYDLVSPEKIYSRYVDKEIELIDKEGKLYSGNLLAYNSGAVTLKEKSGGIKIVQLANITEVNFPELPDGLITRPTLFWRYSSDHSGPLDCRVGYQTSGLEWSAEYVGVLSENEDNLDLSGWSSITNNSGKTYKDATLKLVAGDIHRAHPERGRGIEKNMMTMAAPSKAGFEEKAFFEYHLYTLPRKATVADKEIKQISLFEPASTTVEKKFIYRPDRNPKKVEVAINFTNSAAAGLGMPLPSGRVRLFKADDDGSMILLGEDRIDHTPRNEELNIKVGYAFDIAAEERQMQRDKISSKVEDRTYEIELRNRKETPATVKIEKKIRGIWEVIESDHPYTVKDAQTLQFDVNIGADETVVVKFKIRITRR
ncbi:MAG: DUF4139 domain-containing protein [candidate division Zixibacteria bacterium]|nr:DUF4139 domain-containing protein [candidate division Zixibacteria bacterium]